MRPYNRAPLSSALLPSQHDPDLALYHRNSFPSPQGPSQSWHSIPRSPLYAVPQPQPSEPGPPGVERYQGHHGFVPPPPPPNPFNHHPSPIIPQPPHSALPGYGPQFGGPALAPASADPRHGYPGFRPGPPNHPPAFAQQRDHENRKRTFSDTAIRSSKWKPYIGPPSRENR